jgi:hypothetical protein
MWNPDTESNFKDSAEAASRVLSQFLLIQSVPGIKNRMKTSN